jgi:hypothetical protein
MNKRIYSILQYVIFLGGGLFLVWWQLKSMSDEETNEFYNAIKGANYWIIIPIAIMSILKTCLYKFFELWFDYIKAITPFKLQTMTMMVKFNFLADTLAAKAAEVDAELAKLKSILDGGLKAFNKMVREKELPVVVIK